MPGPRKSERVRLVSEEAAYWYIRCNDEPVMRLSDRRELVTWMRRSPENIAELLRVSGMDGKLGRQRLLAKVGLDESNIIDLGFPPHPPQQNRNTAASELFDDEREESVNNKTAALSWKWAAMVAVMTLTVLLTFVVRDTWFDQTVKTGAGQRQHIILDDGSVVHVGTRTRLKVDFSDTRRVVHLYEGDAVFEVVKDPKRPFVVSTHLIDATAVGTRFEVSIEPGVTTTVSEGIVKITARNDPSDGNVVMLRAGEQLRVSDSWLTEPSVAHVDAERILEWANGWLVFQGETIGEAAKQFNRRNVMQIQIEQPSIGQLKIPSVHRFRVDAPESFVKAVVASHPGINLTADPSKKVLRLRLE